MSGQRYTGRKSVFTILFCLGMTFLFSSGVLARSSMSQGEGIISMKVAGTYDQIMRVSKNVFIDEGYILINDWGGKISFKRVNRDFTDPFSHRRLWDYLTVNVEKKAFHLYVLKCDYRVAESRDGASMNFDKGELKALKKQYKQLLKRVRKEAKE